MAEKKKRRRNLKQERFIDFYIISMNASEAARNAGYKTKSNVIGSQLLANPSIRRAIDKRLAKVHMQANEILSRLADHARGDMGDFLAFSDGIRTPAIDLSRAKSEGKLHLVKKFKQGLEGTSFELYSAKSALDTLAKIAGLVKERPPLAGNTYNTVVVTPKLNHDVIDGIFGVLESAGALEASPSLAAPDALHPAPADAEAGGVSAAPAP